MTNDYPPPDFLEDTVKPRYKRWLDRKAQSLVARDKRRRREKKVLKADYKKKIHDAVERSNGQDYYTGKPLKWCLISKYNGRDAQKGGVWYRREFADLPTVDHEDPTSPETDFRICALRTNDCKSDLKVEQLEKFCRTFLEAQGRRKGHRCSS